MASEPLHVLLVCQAAVADVNSESVRMQAAVLDVPLVRLLTTALWDQLENLHISHSLQELMEQVVQFFFCRQILDECFHET